MKQSPINRINPARRKREWARAYHSTDRVEFVKSLPCAACGRRPSENAHMPSQSGMGRKGDYSTIVPLCRIHHHQLDEGMGAVAFEAEFGISLTAHADWTERQWQGNTTTKRDLIQ